MSQTLIEMVKDLVIEQIRVHHLSPDDAKTLLLSTHATLLSMHHVETPLSGASPDVKVDLANGDWKRSITKHAITCLECGNTFRQLSSRHLRVHDLDSNSYRRKHGIPSTQPLSSREATARRRELAQQIKPWEQAASKRAGAKVETKTSAKRRQAS
jgi:predicted transcriptional regulator